VQVDAHSLKSSFPDEREVLLFKAGPFGVLPDGVIAEDVDSSSQPFGDGDCLRRGRSLLGGSEPLPPARTRPEEKRWRSRGTDGRCSSAPPAFLSHLLHPESIGPAPSFFSCG
jgi:hypothetical protein